MPKLARRATRIVDFVRVSRSSDMDTVQAFSAALYPEECLKVVRTFWQHTGEGVSSRRAAHCKKMYEEGFLSICASSTLIQRQCKGPKRYRRIFSDEHSASSGILVPGSGNRNRIDGDIEKNDRARFVEERFGRNLDMDNGDEAKMAIKQRISGSLTTDSEALDVLADNPRTQDGARLSVDDVYLYPCGMNSIFNTHRILMTVRGQKLKSICFGFPYVDTLKILEKFGPGVLFYGNGSSEDLDDLEQRLENGEKYLALFCEFPSNPLLQTPDIHRISRLAKNFDFAVIIDETIGNFLNVHVLPFADVLVSSLTKIFSGESNVMGGSAILNPGSPYYGLFKQAWDVEYEDTYWCEDAVYMERNSRDFASRNERINRNAEAICEVLQSHASVKKVFYPKFNASRTLYDKCRTKNGGYGGLVSAIFDSTVKAGMFFDGLKTEKGPSLGTNFTLASPYVILAHYKEQKWAAQFGVDCNLVRFSVGLEDTRELQQKFLHALEHDWELGWNWGMACWVCGGEILDCKHSQN